MQRSRTPTATGVLHATCAAKTAPPGIYRTPVKPETRDIAIIDTYWTEPSGGWIIHHVAWATPNPERASRVIGVVCVSSPALVAYKQTESYPA